MMTLAQWLSLAIIALLPVEWILASYLARIPEMQRQALFQFAPMAAMQVAQQSGQQSNEERKARAIAIVAKSFKAAHLPLPSADLVESAVEAATFQLPKAAK